MKKRMIVSVISITLLTLLTMAIPPTLSNPDEETPLYGGTFTFAIQVDVPNLNPLVHTHFTGAGQVQGQILNSLIHYDLEMNPCPELAESWDISPDGLTYTFHLVRNATWSDGVPLTAHDVKYTIDELSVRKAGWPTFWFIESCEELDDYTVAVKLSKPFADYIMWWGPRDMFVVPAHIFEGTDLTTNPHNWEDIVTSGAFKVKNWERGAYIELVRNENYFRGGQPYLDRLIIRTITDAGGRATALENHEVDYVTGTYGIEDLVRFQTIDGLKVEQALTASMGSLTILMNFRRPIFQDLKVRQALNYATDKETLVELVTKNYQSVTHSYIHEHYKITPYFEPDVKIYEYDPVKAEQLLDEANYPRGTDGWRFSIDLGYAYEDPDRVRTAEILSEMFAQVGVNAVLTPMDKPTHDLLINSVWDFDISVERQPKGPTAPPNMKRMYHSDSAIVPDSNIGGFMNAELDALIDASMIEIDTDKLAEQIRGQQIILNDNAVEIRIFDQYDFHVYWDEFVGVPQGPYNYVRDGVDGVWWTGGSLVSPKVAEDAIKSAESEINDLISQGYDCTQSLLKLNEAKAAQDEKDYESAQTIANAATSLAIEPSEPLEPSEGEQGPPGPSGPAGEDAPITLTYLSIVLSLVSMAIAIFVYTKK